MFFSRFTAFYYDSVVNVYGQHERKFQDAMKGLSVTLDFRKKKGKGGGGGGGSYLYSIFGVVRALLFISKLPLDNVAVPIH